MKIRQTYPLSLFQIPQSKYIIIDCDVGGDDALCILIAKYLADKYNKEIIGITCVQGNTKLSNVVTNAVISSKIAGLSIPIAKGAWMSLLGHKIIECGDKYFNQDGLGGKQEFYSKFVNEDDYKKIFKKKANQSIVLASHKYAHNVSILALGPLTNLATAYLLDNTLPQRINSVSIMGGSFSAVGRHQHFSSDFNFHLDPEAASVVLQNYKRIILTTIEFTSSFKLINQEKVFANRDTLKAQYIADLYQPIIAKHKHPILCDPLAAFPLFCPDDAEVMVYKAWGSVILNGKRTRGMLSLDWLQTDKKNFNQIYIVAQMNNQHIQKMAMESLIN